MSFAISMFTATGNINAQTDRELQTYPFIDAIPKPSGVGQPILVNFGLLNNLARATDGWNVTAVITDPDGHVETFARMTWSTGTVGITYVPTKEGEYKLQCKFGGEYYNSGNPISTAYYTASESEVVTIQVTTEWQPTHPGFDLPDEYWVRPIDAQLREWWSIAGSWVAKPLNGFAPYNDAPESAHILWTMPIGDTLGGLTGGLNGDVSFQDGDAYEGKFTGNMIMGGVLYYNKYAYNGVTGRQSPNQAIVAVDLHTGEKLWERSYDFGGGRIATGQILTWLSMNNRGTFAYIWLASGTDMFALDAKTGDLRYNMTNVPSGTIYWGENGEMLKYQLVNYGTTDNPNYHLLEWNSSRVTGATTGSWGSGAMGSYNASLPRCYNFNVSIGAGTVLNGSILYAFPYDRVVVGAYSSERIILSAISLKPGEEGRMIFTNKEWYSPNDLVGIAGEAYVQSQWSAISQEDLVITFWVKDSRTNYAFSLENGGFLWKTDPQIYADAWTSGGLGGCHVIVYHKLISASVGGIVYCHDVKTGELLWTYEAADKYTESYLAQSWWIRPQFASCGKVYFAHEEHSAQEPKPRGVPYFALDVETGEEIWRIDGAFRQSNWGGRSIIGDSIIVTQDTYNQQIYAIGKGPSAMTVTTPDVSIAVNKPILIKGTIMDISPGTQNTALQLRFPNGVPAIADACMSEWMLYVYKQFDRPHEAVGVPVTIAAVDPTGNYVTLGNTVSDASGNYVVEFTPTTEGQYTIYAYFDGSASYYGTSAQDTLLVTSADTTTNTNNNPPYELYIIGMGIVVIVVNLIAILLFRKK
ncbi:MAG: PQQ-binding-like beta-propeller repeat protein [Candidatus Bathyarchaeota archaeon]|nr:PQQ-binding-like beta-propeller repeat protein [Candidatus Termiticorpusculum sp.]